MDLTDLQNLQILRKANRCATLFEMLANELGFNATDPNTNWRDIAKAYSITMEDAFKLQQTSNNETAKD